MGYDPYIGEITIFAGTFPPYGYAFCDGSLLPINQNQALFSLLGTQYGGDGRTTFALPDLRGRVPVGAGQGVGMPYRAPGTVFGAATATLTVDQVVSEVAVADESQTVTATVTKKPALVPTPPVAATQTVPTQPPSLAIHYIISLYGIYPSRW